MKPQSRKGLIAACSVLAPVLAAVALALLAVASAAMLFAAEAPASGDGGPASRLVIDNPAADDVEPAETEDRDSSAVLVNEPGDRPGRQVFAEACAACHGGDGRGRIGPALAGNSNLERSDYILALILRGGDGMPAFHGRLSEGEIAAVSNHIRTSWGNYFGTVSRGQLASQWWQGADRAELYQRVCARCHGAEGGGHIGPPLARNENLKDPQYVAGKILHGQGGMPAFEPILDAGRVADLASYIRTAFGNDHGRVEPETVRGLLSLAGGQESGILHATVSPGEARLAIVGPGRFVRVETQSRDVLLSGLLPGSYTLTATKEGYRAAVAAVNVAGSSDEILVSLELEPLAGPANDDGRERPPRERSGTVVATRPGADEPERAGVRLGVTNLQEYVRSCAACHGPEGRGGVGPALAGNVNLESSEFVLDRILHGAGRMPPFAPRLSDGQIAAIATHERVGWGNGFEKVAAGDVEELRQAPTPPEAPAAETSSGSDLYARHCAACHGSQGRGGVAPALRGNSDLRYVGLVASRIVMGGDGMPPFNEVLSSAEIAAVASYIRTAWDNEFGLVSTSQAQNYHGGPSSLGP